MGRTALIKVAFIVMTACLVGVSASACPLCHTSTAAEVREKLSATIGDGTIWMAMFLPPLSIGALIGVMNHRELNAEKGATQSQNDGRNR